MITSLFIQLAMAAEPDSVHMNLDQFLALYEQSKNRPKPPEEPPRSFAVPSARLTGEVVSNDGVANLAILRGRIVVDNLSGDWVRIPVLPRAVALRSARIGGRDAPLVLDGDAYTLVTRTAGQQTLDVEFAVPLTVDKGVVRMTAGLGLAGATEIELALPGSDAVDIVASSGQVRNERVEGNRRMISIGVPVGQHLNISWQRALPEEAARDARIVAEMTTLVTLGDGIVKANVRVEETVLFAGVSQLKFQVPTGMTVIGVTGTGLRDWKAEEGTLTVKLAYAAEGAVHLSVDLERPMVASEQELSLPVLQPIGVERTRGSVGVAVLGTLEIDGDRGTTGAVAVDPRALPALTGMTAQPVLVAWKYLGSEVKIPVALADNDDVEVLVTLLDQANATTMVTTDGRRLTRVVWQVRNNRRQFLRLSMPGGAEVWSARVGGHAVQPARDGMGLLLLPLVRSDTGPGTAAAFDVEIVYVETGEAPVSGRARFDASLPVADAPTSYVAWTVYAPTEAKVPPSSVGGNLRHVEYLSRPVEAASVMSVPGDDGIVMNQAQGQIAAGALGQGSAPVEVTLPLTGQPFSFEKLLVLDETLSVGFDWRVKP